VTDNIVSAILWNRYGETLDVDEFLHGDFNLFDPFLMMDMSRATRRIKQAIDNKEKITIFGDYDVDGVTATALLVELFDFLEYPVDVHIPDRYEEGYGLKLSSLREIREGGTDLVITVDCGIRDEKVIDKMQAEGLDIIVTDHHNLGDKLPDCQAVLNPKRPQCEYPEKNLAGVGVAYVLARGLLAELGGDEKKIEWWLKWNLDLVAVGTIADMVPLTGENRTLVKYGLIVVNRRSRIGIRKLLSVAGKERGEITARDVAYVIAPRLNAAGRLNHAMNAFNLLLEKGELEAEFLAKNLDSNNTRRQELTSEILLQVYTMINQNDLPPAVVLADKKWPCGVVGLVSSRIVEKYHRPAFIAGIEGDMVRGSVRSVPGLNIVQILGMARDELQNYGGHDMAAGYSVPLSAWDRFQKKIRKCVAEKMKQIDPRKKISIDIQVEAAVINMKLWQSINFLAPFGVDNQEPVMLLAAAKLRDKKVIGRDMNHLKLNFIKATSGRAMEGLWWSNASFNDRFQLEKEYDILFRLEMNEYRGNQNVYLNIIDVRESKTK